LQNFAKRYLVLGNEDAMVAELRAGSAGVEQVHLPGRLPENGGDLKEMVRNMKGAAEAEAIARALEQSHGNRKKAAELLNISYKALVYKSRQYGILPPKPSSSRSPDNTPSPSRLQRKP
jgi:DNA-binding NtrC family response regulator